MQASGDPGEGLPRNMQWLARRRLERFFTLEKYMGWTKETRPKWCRPFRELFVKRNKRISNMAFEAYNEAIRGENQAGAKNL